jgi:putative hydrolase of the HAD superfamily
MRIEALVFDLDDTLVDTTGLLIEPADIDAATAMIGAGLQGSLEDVVRERKKARVADPPVDVDVTVALAFGATDPAVAAAGRQAFFHRRVRALHPVDDAHPTLDALADRRLFLMTQGHPDTQRAKVALTKLGRHFEAISYVDHDTDNKLDALRRMVAEHGLSPEATVVVGDRIDAEIEAGRRVGTWTVRVDHGEGRRLRTRSRYQQPHYTVPGVAAIPAVLEDIEASEFGPDGDE